MTWIHRHRLRHHLRDSMWIGPCVGVIAGLLVARAAHRVDVAFGWKMSLNADAARTVLITLSSTMLTFVVFVSSALLVALQLASAQLTPRIIAVVFRDPLTKIAMGVFVFTFTLSTAVALRVGEWVPAVTVQLAAYSCVASLALFLYLIDHIGKLLRPANALRTVALRGRDVIESVYPHTLAEYERASRAPRATRGAATDAPIQAIASHRDGVILACDIEGLVRHARAANGLLEIVPQVGDFVAKGDPLLRWHGARTVAHPDAVRRMIVIGYERSMEQDPAFVFRIIADIACKALSPAINDPTTAVLAIDQLQHLLTLVGNRHLDDERVCDGAGTTRLVYRTPGWEDFVHLAVTEVRQYGRESIQVSRRLHAMLESLLRVLPTERAAELNRELDILNRSTTRSFAEPEDRAMAAAGDRQGVGGSGVDNGDTGSRRVAEDLVAHVPAGTDEAPSRP